MSRVAMANQCREPKPKEPNDEKTYYCQKEWNHRGEHSSGPHRKWGNKKDKKA